MERQISEAQRNMAIQLNDSKKALVGTLNEYLAAGSLIARDGISKEGVQRIDRAWREFHNNLFTYTSCYSDPDTQRAVEDMRPTQWQITGPDGSVKPYLPGDEYLGGDNV